MRRILSVILCLSLLTLPVRAAEQPKYVALTFDDGPSGRFTRRLLAGLEERDVKATFLLCGYRLKEYPRLAEKIYASGHEIGLHGYSHKDMGKMTAREAAKEISDTISLLPAGCKPVFLRPPGGSSGDGVTKAAEEAGLALLNWSVDPRDWATQDATAIEKAVLDQVKDGDIILLHDMSDSSVDAALRLIPKLQRQGYRFVTASEQARAKGITLLPGKQYFRFLAEENPK